VPPVSPSCCGSHHRLLRIPRCSPPTISTTIACSCCSRRAFDRSPPGTHCNLSTSWTTGTAFALAASRNPACARQISHDRSSSFHVSRLPLCHLPTSTLVAFAQLGAPHLSVGCCSRIGLPGLCVIHTPRRQAALCVPKQRNTQSRYLRLGPDCSNPSSLFALRFVPSLPSGDSARLELR
jgi:hypothetical protein